MYTRLIYIKLVEIKRLYSINLIYIKLVEYNILYYTILLYIKSVGKGVGGYFNKKTLVESQGQSELQHYFQDSSNF
jgi:hypothetical protein